MIAGVICVLINQRQPMVEQMLCYAEVPGVDPCKLHSNGSQAEARGQQREALFSQLSCKNHPIKQLFAWSFDLLVLLQGSSKQGKGPKGLKNNKLPIFMYVPNHNRLGT